MPLPKDLEQKFDEEFCEDTFSDPHKGLRSDIKLFLSQALDDKVRGIREDIEASKIPVMGVGVSLSGNAVVTDITYRGVSQDDWDVYNKAHDDILSLPSLNQ